MALTPGAYVCGHGAVALLGDPGEHAVVLVVDETPHFPVTEYGGVVLVQADGVVASAGLAEIAGAWVVARALPERRRVV